MSLFLGPIHHWLYNKVIWFEAIEKEITQWAESKELPIKEWNQEIHLQYGEPLDDSPLEAIIDGSNIHGWLQGKITNAELRQAALVTKIINTDLAYQEELMEIFASQGMEAAKAYDQTPDTPEAMYKVLNDFLLEGMPCDRVDELVHQDDKEYRWQTTTCLHTPYWEQVGGDVHYFYTGREAWIQAFVTTLNPNLMFEKLPGNSQRIVVK